MNTTNIKSELDGTLSQFIAVMAGFEQEQFNTVPFEGSWTAGELAKHVLISDSGFADMMNGAVSDTERAPDLRVEDIKSVFLDFSTKMKSPDFTVPPKAVYEKMELLSGLETMKSQMDEIIATKDLSKTCTSFELPVYGFLTRLESVYFVIYHTQRHVHQLQHIYEKLHENESDGNRE